jgi:O-6-methylguanine DNA methyltransferase
METRSITHGEVRSYKWVVGRCGSPGGARAFGSALGSNPFPLFVPCHPVVHSNGTTGNFSCGGRINGPALKTLLLRWEKGDKRALKEMSVLFEESR